MFENNKENSINVKAVCAVPDASILRPLLFLI